MAMGNHKKQSQKSFWVATDKLTRTAGHPFYRKVNELLANEDFDAFAESCCAKFYAEKKGRPGIPPGVYFRMLMVANLLAHTDLFRAGIARSGSYNKTTQPFGFQSERRSLFEARDVYIQVSPTFFANRVDEPVLIIHGDGDSNPGTLTFQSEVFFEAVSGSGGTARLVLLPFEDHGYRTRESIEHVLWEQIEWFDE